MSNVPMAESIDAILHVNPSIDEKGLLMVYNPLDHAVKQNLTINVYYTGLSTVASVSENGGKAKKYPCQQRI